jgi:type II secretory pathway predicted ATPase ExeA
MSHQQPGQDALASSSVKQAASPFITDCHRNAADSLGSAFANARPVAILIGDGKSGASFVINRFLDGLGEDVTTVRITEPCSNAIQVMREVVTAIGFDPKDMSLTDLEQVFKMFLFFQRSRNRRTIICVEETQDNGQWVLDRIRRLVEAEAREKFGMMVILAGRPSLNDLLKEAPLNAICANGAKRIVLAPFTIEETKEYIRRRVEGTGASEIDEVFSFNAITAIQALTSGVPDEVSKLCSKCLELADMEGSAPVSPTMVERAAKLLRLATMVQAPHAIAQEVQAIEARNRSTGRLIASVNGTVAQEQDLNGGHILIGRDELCDIRLDNIQVSRHHALIVNSSMGVKLVDLGSTNGTFVNGRKIRKYTLQDSDKLTVGDCSIEFVAGDGHRPWYFDIDPTVTLESSRVGLTMTGNGSGRARESTDATRTMAASWHHDSHN